MRQVVIYNCPNKNGRSFCLSSEGVERILELKELSREDISDSDFDLIKRNIYRDDPELVQLVKELEGWVDGFKIVEIPEDIEWYVASFGGEEWIVKVRRR